MQHQSISSKCNSPSQPHDPDTMWRVLIECRFTELVWPDLESRCHTLTNLQLITTRKCRTLWGRAWASSCYGYTWIDAEMMSWIASVWVLFMHDFYLKWFQPGVYEFCTGCKQPAVDGRSIAAVTNKSKVLCVLKLEPTPLQLPMLHLGNSPAPIEAIY